MMSAKTKHTVLGAVLMAAAVAAGSPSGARGQGTDVRCPDGQGPQLDLGIGAISFTRANLLPSDDRPVRMIWRFDSEPAVASVRRGGPADGKLVPRDQIVSIDGLLITSIEGGRRWSGVGAGRTVALVVRRAGREVEVRIVGSFRCESLPGRGWRGMRGRYVAGLALALPLDSGASPRSADRGRVFSQARRYYAQALGGVSARFRVQLGFGLSCVDCSFLTDSTGAAIDWRFNTSPVVTLVEDGGPAARAGLRLDDVIEAVDGVSIVTEEGSRRFSEAQPGRPVRLAVRRGEQTLALEIVPRSGDPAGRTPPPDRPE